MLQDLTSALQAFAEGRCDYAGEFLGCHRLHHDGIDGFVFRVWAPNAAAVSVVGDFNFWNEEDLPMQPIGWGVWEAFSRYAKEGGAYKFCVTHHTGRRVHKADPYATRCAALPEKSSIVWPLDGYRWHDGAFLRKLEKEGTLDRPVNIYEMHLGSWRAKEDGTPLGYREIAAELVPYLQDMGYTHVEIMPVSEYPFEGSWGYQVTGYFAPTFRYGTPQDFMAFVDACHKGGIGVILDWVPAHFPKDEHGLYEFDGTCQYELSDPMMNEHPDWGTRIFDYGRGEVRSFLISSAVHWIKNYHVDGIRVDAVASMLYLDYNRQNYRPNRYGGKENLEAIDFLRACNRACFAVKPNVMMIAEESTAFPLITKPDYEGGLGFLYKWNMGWMNDMLDYMKLDPLWRKGDHNALTFSMTYAFSENFILPLSHDEVVHGKASLVNKMPGSYDDKFSNLRAFYMYMMAHPGKKLLFMGGEFAQFIEWNYKQPLDWLLLDYDRHRQMQAFVRKLNHFYRENTPLWQNDRDWDGFRWIQADDRDNSVISFRRIDRKGREILVVCNFCPVERTGYRMGVPKAGWYVPIFNSDAAEYGGTDTYVPAVKAFKKPWSELAYSGDFTLPPLSVVYYRHTRTIK